MCAPPCRKPGDAEKRTFLAWGGIVRGNWLTRFEVDHSFSTAPYSPIFVASFGSETVKIIRTAMMAPPIERRIAQRAMTRAFRARGVMTEGGTYFGGLKQTEVSSEKPARSYSSI